MYIRKIMKGVVHLKIIRCMVLATVLILNFIPMTTQHVLRLCKTSRAEVRRSFITTTVRDESQVTPQGRHW